MLALQQKLEGKTDLFKSETEMIDKIRMNARKEDIELSEEDDEDQSDEDNEGDENTVNTVQLLNIKSESVDNEK